jgi:hypothetical protein
VYRSELEAELPGVLELELERQMEMDEGSSPENSDKHHQSLTRTSGKGVVRRGVRKGKRGKNACGANSTQRGTRTLRTRRGGFNRNCTALYQLIDKFNSNNIPGQSNLEHKISRTNEMPSHA